MRFDPILDYQDNDSEFEIFYRIAQSKAVESYKWYSAHSLWPRLLFRTSGIIVIIFSITIPVLAANQLQYKDLWITVMAMSIAIASALNSFYRWGEKWQSFIRSELAIKHLIAIWQIELSNAKQLTTESERLIVAAKATEKLINAVGRIEAVETEEYFNKVDWPKKQDS